MSTGKTSKTFFDFVKPGQLWHMEPGYLGSGHKLTILQVKRNSVIVHDTWYVRRSEQEYTIDHLLAFYRPLSPEVMAKIDKWRLTQ